MSATDRTGVTEPQSVATYLNERRIELSEVITRRHYELRPELEARYGSSGRFRCREDAAYHIAYLAQAVALSAPEIFNDYVCWAKIMLRARNVPVDDLSEGLDVLGTVLKQELPEKFSPLPLQYVRAARHKLGSAPDEVPCFLTETDHLTALAQKYLAALLDYDRNGAKRLIIDALAAGLSVRDLYKHVFAPAQLEVGRLWQLNQINVAEEHYCTAATELIMAQIYAPESSINKKGRRMIGMCVTGDLHELGAHMLCDLFEMDGWDTTYLGANVPIASAQRMIKARKPNLVAISASIPYYLSAVADMIQAIRNVEEFARGKIIVGGGAFKVRDLWKKVGADGYAKDASEALEAATRLVA